MIYIDHPRSLFSQTFT